MIIINELKINVLQMESTYISWIFVRKFDNFSSVHVRLVPFSSFFSIKLGHTIRKEWASMSYCDPLNKGMTSRWGVRYAKRGLPSLLLFDPTFSSRSKYWCVTGYAD